MGWSTWYMDAGAVVEVLWEELRVQGCTHHNYFQIRSFCNQILQNQQQEVTVRQESCYCQTRDVLLCVRSLSTNLSSVRSWTSSTITCVMSPSSESPSNLRKRMPVVQNISLVLEDCTQETYTDIKTFFSKNAFNCLKVTVRAFIMFHISNKSFDLSILQIIRIYRKYMTYHSA